MQKRSVTGIMIFVLSIGGFFVYAYLLMLSVGGILGVISWIGYMMATVAAKPASLIDDDH